MKVITALKRAAAAFRAYEAHHRDEADLIHAPPLVAARLDKATRNGELAAECEQAIASMERWVRERLAIRCDTTQNRVTLCFDSASATRAAYEELQEILANRGDFA